MGSVVRSNILDYLKLIGKWKAGALITFPIIRDTNARHSQRPGQVKMCTEQTLSRYLVKATNWSVYKRLKHRAECSANSQQFSWLEIGSLNIIIIISSMNVVLFRERHEVKSEVSSNDVCGRANSIDLITFSSETAKKCHWCLAMAMLQDASSQLCTLWKWQKSSQGIFRLSWDCGEDAKVHFLWIQYCEIWLKLPDGMTIHHAPAKRWYTLLEFNLETIICRIKVNELLSAHSTYSWNKSMCSEKHG